MFRAVLDERKRREIDPTLAMLRECIAEADAQKEKDVHTRERLKALCDFFELTTAWYSQLRSWPPNVAARFVKLGDRVLKLLNIGR